MKPLIIFIHGFCESAEIWDHLVGETNKHYDCIAINLPGFAGEPLEEISDLGQIARIISEQLPPSRKWILIGHSLGGYISLEILKNFGSRVSQLVLFHSTALPDTVEKKINRDRTYKFIQEHGKEPFLKQFVPSLFFGDEKTQFGHRQKLTRIALQTPTPTILKYTQWMRDRKNYLDILRKSKVPVLYIAGDSDNFLSLDILKEEVAENSCADIAIIKNCGHLGMIEEPQKCSEILMNYLEGQNL